MSNIEHERSIKRITDFFKYDVGMVYDYNEELRRLADSLPKEPFSPKHLKELRTFADDSYTFMGIVVIFALAGHKEILPYAIAQHEQETLCDLKLVYAAAIALLGEESGYQFIESFFKRFMNKEQGLEKFDFEVFVHIFENILTNERGQEMITRFRDEADYHVVWIDSNTEPKD
ncbi:hypothetical protein EBR21_08915 [bacterium]|nr:hypothetical protein [bacterium]